MTIPSCNMCYLSESFCLFARSLAFMLLVIKENGVNDIKDLPPVGQSLLTRTSSLWFPDPGPLSQCLPPLTEHTKYLTVSSLPISIVCGPSSISFSLLMAFICVCHKYYNIIIINNKHSYINDGLEPWSPCNPQTAPCSPPPHCDNCHLCWCSQN